jgi:hypothetical protein
VDQFQQGLRCQDVHSGLRNVDPNSASLTPLADTRIIGMAATVAGLVRGRDVVQDAQALRMVAAEQLDVDPLAFNEVVKVLEAVDFVQGVKEQGGKISSFTETVPYYDDLYASLGRSWSDRQPTELEQQMLTLVDRLAIAPVPFEDLESAMDLDHGDMPHLLDVGKQAGLVHSIRTVDGDLAYSPFFGFEQPALLADLVTEHGTDRLAQEFEAVRASQGLPVTMSAFPLLTDAVARGLVMAPSVRLPNGTDQPFAALPYLADRKLLTARKPVLDKALAVLACLRCAEQYGGYNNLSPAGLVAVIGKLLDPNRGWLNPHGSHERQYQLMHRAGLIVFGPDTRPGGNWKVPRFVDTVDNREALALARDLITHGEPLANRVDDAAARQALQAGTGYLAPLQTMARSRDKIVPSPKHWAKVFEAAMGTAPL